jgi:hypothetical protein
MKQYQKENIEILSIQQLPSGSTEIQYKPILESMYYCPGASIYEEGGRQKISLVRCGIKEKCNIDAIAEKLDQGIMKIVVPSTPESIDFVFSDGVIRAAQ